MKKDFLAILGRNSTKRILDFLEEHDYVLYKDLLQFSTPYSLRRILKDLLDYKLIKCFCSPGITEFELTERGKKALEALRELIEILNSEPENNESG